MTGLIWSDQTPALDWADVKNLGPQYGVKAATSLTIPRAWTLPFVALPVEVAERLAEGAVPVCATGSSLISDLPLLAGPNSQLILRSSVVGESIWDRGTYRSEPFSVTGIHDDDAASLMQAAKAVLASTSGCRSGLMLQRYIRPLAQGEFGNLQRVSKSRDQWEIATREADGITTRVRLNSQRDEAASVDEALIGRVGLARERLFGSIGAWLNNDLLLGRFQRLNCEWVSDNRQFFLVQIDEEDEDLAGVNPFQVNVPPAIRPEANSGAYLKLADGESLREWDKLQVLEELWESGAAHKPTLFYVAIAELPIAPTAQEIESLSDDFSKLIGTRGIIVRTSVKAGTDKLPNLPRTECLTPEAAARWCFENAERIRADHPSTELAFVAHRFVASRASVWARAEPMNPLVEINALWGLPDALQYCPYDIWEVHVPTGIATDYPEYKSDMLISSHDGGWQYVRVKNELARNNCIGSVEAKDIALRSAQIASRLGRACHIMWFVGCVDPDGALFNIPWYWTEAHAAERNPDRTAYRIFTVVDRESLTQFEKFSGSRVRQALALRPTDLELMRDIRFIEAVGRAAASAQVPVILSGSPLAHAYYQLRKLGCTVVTPSEKGHARVRRSANLGKLVRDKIPDRIGERQELSLTRQVEGKLKKGFLIGKLVEEALEVRDAANTAQKTEELADLFEVFRAMAKAEGIDLEAVREAADRKRQKAGGFEEGLILIQTAVGPLDRASIDSDRIAGNVLGEQTVGDRAEIPFSFFGFMEFDQGRSVYFEDLGVWLELVLRPDRLEVRLARNSEQLSLPLKSDLDPEESPLDTKGQATLPFPHVGGSA